MQWKLGAETFTDADSNGRESLVKGGTTTGHTIKGLAAGTARDVRVVATRTGAATPAAVPTRSLLSVRSASVAEDAGAAVTVDVTAAFPAGAAALVTDAAVTVRVLPKSTAVVGTDYAIAPATRAIVIPGEAASATLTFAVTPIDNADDDCTRTIAFVAMAPPAGFTVAPATLAITNDDVSGLTVSTTALDMAEAGETAIYTVRLNTAPSANVTVTVTSRDLAVATVDTDTATAGD